jgi:hypothetical protein
VQQRWRHGVFQSRVDGDIDLFARDARPHARRSSGIARVDYDLDRLKRLRGRR